MDACVLLEGINPPRGSAIPASVAAEVGKGAPARRLEMLVSAGLRVLEPTSASVSRVIGEAGRLGETGRLSPPDADVVALAVDLGATVLSDDYAVQNVARALGIPFRPVGQKGIGEVRSYAYRCAGCGRWFDGPMLQCPVCGSEVAPKRRRVGKGG